MDRDSRARLVAAASIVLNYLSISDEPRPADIIWGLGSNEKMVPHKAAEFFRAGLASWVVFSGGNGYRWRELNQTEADLFAHEATNCGVPEARLIIENRSVHTGENITFTLRILDELSLTVDSALLITIPPFQRRAAITLATHRRSIRCINSPVCWGSVSDWGDAKLVEASRLCSGEIRRLQDYPERGFIEWDPKAIPSAVIGASGEIETLLHILG
jgi:hypothetical protein